MKLEEGQYYLVCCANPELSLINEIDRRQWVTIKRDSVILVLGYAPNYCIEYIYNGEFVRTRAYELQTYCHLFVGHWRSGKIYER